MKSSALFHWALSAGLLIALSLSLVTWQRTSVPPAGRDAASSSNLHASLAAVEDALHRLQQDVNLMKEGIAESPNDSINEDGQPQLVERLNALESHVGQFQKTFDTLNLAKTSQEREEAFRGEFGYEKADEYAALGSHAIAGNGYLQFLESHPEHPDARDILQKARDAYLKAGYKDKAAWVQQQVMERYPESRADDAYKMALMLKQQKRYDEALEFIDEAAQAASNDVSRLWRLHYRAFLIQQRDGNAAGAAAYRQLLQQIEAANLSEDNLGVEARKRIADLDTRVANSGS